MGRPDSRLTTLEPQAPEGNAETSGPAAGVQAPIRPLAELAAPGAPEPLIRLGPGNFRRRDGRVLLTNDAGRWAELPEGDFQRLLAGRLGPADPISVELESKGFLRDRMDFRALASAVRDRNLPLFQPGPSLHMMVVTLRCNQA